MIVEIVTVTGTKGGIETETGIETGKKTAIETTRTGNIPPIDRDRIRKPDERQIFF